MNELQKVFEYQGANVRTVSKNGEPWFVAKDVTDILDIDRSQVRRLDDDERDMCLIHTPGGEQEGTIINEAGLYSLVLGSRKPEAKTFKRWVTHEVIPAIRKHGAYMTPETIEKVLMNPDTIIKIATQLKEERERRVAAEKRIEADKPKVLFADAVTASSTSILVGELAKLIKQNGYDIGQNRLFQWLRDNGYLIRRSGNDYNMPTQNSMDMSLFEIKETSIVHSDGHTTINKTPKVTGKGQVYFINKFLKGLTKQVLWEDGAQDGAQIERRSH